MQITLRYTFLALVAFALNLLWERAHLPLYQNYAALGAGWPLVLWASGGDVLYIILVVVVVALWRRDILWFEQARRKELVLAAALGFIVAFIVEYKALLLHRWGYALAMPIVPLLHVGLSPLLQMSILTPFSAWLSGMVALPTPRDDLRI